MAEGAAPVVSIWLMDENTLRGATGVHHRFRFRVRDDAGFLGLSDTPVLESAMSVLIDFQTNAARNDLYRSRLDYLRVQNTMADELAQALADTEQALADTERALADTAQALARVARLRERLRAAGIDPNSE